MLSITTKALTMTFPFHLNRFVLPLFVLLLAGAAQPVSAQQLISSAELAYPNPAFPYYHFRADLNIEDPSMMDVEVSVNGEPIRYVDVRDRTRKVNTRRPIIHYREPTADATALSNLVFKEPYILCWLPWRPGEEYEIRVGVRLRNSTEPSDDDRAAQETVTLTAPSDAKVFDPRWRNYTAAVLTETTGIDRQQEPVELLMVMYADQAANIRNDVRVLEYHPGTHGITEIPSQVYNINFDALGNDPLTVPNPDGTPRDIPTWVATTTARVTFQADVPARESRIYLIYYNNPDASAPNYDSSLQAGGPPPGILLDAERRVVEKPGYTIENDQIRVMLHPLSGLLHELDLKSVPGITLEHKMETNGSIHWTPETWTPPRPWSHASDWLNPRFESWSGPIGAGVHLYQGLPYVPEVDASITYEFFEGLPYILMSSSTRFREALPVLATRNMEIVIRRGLLTHLAWYDALQGEVMTVNLEEDIADLDLILMESEVPWLTIYNPETGIALGGIQIKSINAGVENRPRAPTPYFYVNVGPWVYWSHSHYLSGSGKSSNPQLVVEVPQGTLLRSELGLVLYQLGSDDDPHRELIDWQKKLTHPLHVRVVEEVQPRVPGKKPEIYIDPTRTGWEGYER